MEDKKVTMEKAVRLTKARAKTLIKRELGISAAELMAPPQMNQNPKYPWFEVQTGNLTISVYTNKYMDSKIIVLWMSFYDGLGSLGRYFYADTLEEAPEYAAHRYWENVLEVTEKKDIVALARRYSKEAQNACLAHFEKRPSTDR